METGNKEPYQPNTNTQNLPNTNTQDQDMPSYRNESTSPEQDLSNPNTQDQDTPSYRNESTRPEQDKPKPKSPTPEQPVCSSVSDTMDEIAAAINEEETDNSNNNDEVDGNRDSDIAEFVDLTEEFPKPSKDLISYIKDFFSEIASWILQGYNYILSFVPSGNTFAVGIITRSRSDDSEWMEKQLRSPAFQEHVTKIKVICLSEAGEETVKDGLSSCSCLLLYITARYIDGTGDPVDTTDLDRLLSLYGKKNVILVVGDLETKESEEKMEVTLNDKFSCETLLFTKREIRYCIKNLGLSQPEKGKLETINEILSGASKGITFVTGSDLQDCLNMYLWIQGETVNSLGLLGFSVHNKGRKLTVGIFSRSSESDYEWLSEWLRSPALQGKVADVQPFYISNNGGERFRDGVSQCTFAILYHTKRWGRINITDVTDSLYDDELDYLSYALGKDNVIVVVDDLDDSSSEEKKRILKNQPSIGTQAKDLILFTQEERDPDYRTPDTQHEMEDRRTAQDKQDRLITFLKKAKEHSENENKRCKSEGSEPNPTGEDVMKLGSSVDEEPDREEKAPQGHEDSSISLHVI